MVSPWWPVLSNVEVCSRGRCDRCECLSKKSVCGGWLLKSRWLSRVAKNLLESLPPPSRFLE
jgi:hypothetical protein